MSDLLAPSSFSINQNIINVSHLSPGQSNNGFEFLDLLNDEYMLSDHEINSMSKADKGNINFKIEYYRKYTKILE